MRNVSPAEAQTIIARLGGPERAAHFIGVSPRTVRRMALSGAAGPDAFALRAAFWAAEEGAALARYREPIRAA